MPKMYAIQWDADDYNGIHILCKFGKDWYNGCEMTLISDRQKDGHTLPIPRSLTLFLTGDKNLHTKNEQT